MYVCMYVKTFALFAALSDHQIFFSTQREMLYPYLAM